MPATGVHKIGGGRGRERLPRKWPTKRQSTVVVFFRCSLIVFVSGSLAYGHTSNVPPPCVIPDLLMSCRRSITFFADPLRVTLPFRPACQWLGVPAPNDLGCSFDWHNLLFEGCFLIGTRPVSTRQGFIDGGRR